MKKLLGLLALAACTGIPADSPISPEVVELVTISGGGTCTAFPVAQGRGKTYYLTAKHCTPAALVGGKAVGEIYLHPTRDVAMLVVESEESVFCLPLASEKPAPGDVLFAIGFHLGDFPLVTQGYAGGLEGQMSAPVIWGASGGPVLNAEGEVVGVLSWGWMVELNNWTYVPVTHIAGYAPYDDVSEWVHGLLF